MFSKNLGYYFTLLLFFLIFSSVGLFVKNNLVQAGIGGPPCSSITPSVEKVCPPGNVKYEVGSGYEYTDGSATVAIHPGGCCGKNWVSWSANECYRVTGVCVKIGGPCGGALINPSPSDGRAGPFPFDISHVVLTTEYTCQEPGFYITVNRPELECGTNYVKFNGEFKRTEDMYIKFIINGRYPEVFYGEDSWYTGELTLNPGDYEIRVELWLRGCKDKLVDSQDDKFTIEECQPKPTPTSVPSDGGSTSGHGGPVGAPSCGAPTPNAPYLVSATAIGGNKVKLVWQKVDGATHYTISYGPSSGNYPWGVPNTGDVDEFEIGEISSGCFIVRAVNDCAPSDPSNEVCTGQVAGQVLGLSATSGESNYSYIIIGFASILFGTKLIRRENFI